MKRFLLAGGVAATTLIWQVEAALAASDSEKTPVNLPLDQVQQQAGGGNSNSASGGLMRTFIGLLVVVAVIYGLYWILKQVKSSREERASGSGLGTLATLPLGPNRSLHLVRAGGEVVLLGVGEGGVTPIRTYGEHEARALGLLVDEDGEDADPKGSPSLPGGLGETQAKPGLLEAVRRSLDDLRAKTVIK
jgi:flagellar protein FliO/FliZ